jgi:hypothetical protein
MCPVAAKLGFPQTVGAFCDGQTVYLAHVASTPVGATVLARIAEPLDGEDETEGIARAIGRLRAPRGGLRLVLGVPTEHCYLATRPVSAATGTASARVLLRESLRSASAPVDKMVADVVRAQPGKRELASIAACPRAMVAPLETLLEGRRGRLVRAEPAPCALLRLAHKEDRRGHKAKVLVRVFLGPRQALAVLTGDGHPILWRTTPLPPGDEAAAILALVRSLASVAKPCGVDNPPEALVIHGRTDLERLIDADWLGQELALHFRWLKGPELDGEQIAFGLALGGLDDNEASFDLAKEFCRPVSLREVFPWRDAALYLVVLAAMAGFLGSRRRQVEDACRAARAPQRPPMTAPVSTSDLERERKDLAARVSAIERFLDTRVLWTACLRELATTMPSDVYLTSVSGTAELDGPQKGKAAAKRSLVIKGAVSLPESGLVPHEVDRLVSAIRQHPAITEHFPVVELAELKRFHRVGDGELAMFTVICLPKGCQKRT